MVVIYIECLYAADFYRPWTVVRDRVASFMDNTLKPLLISERIAESRATADAFHNDGNIFRAGGLHFFGERGNHLRRSERRRLLWTGEAERTGGSPGNHIAFNVVTVTTVLL